MIKSKITFIETKFYYMFKALFRAAGNIEFNIRSNYSLISLGDNLSCDINVDKV